MSYKGRRFPAQDLDKEIRTARYVTELCVCSDADWQSI